MPPKKSSKPSVGLRHPSTYVYSLMANRYSIQREEGFVLACFGLVSKKGVPLESFTCIFSDDTLKRLKENILQYSDVIGLPKGKKPDWTPEPAKENIFKSFPVIDFIHLTNWEDTYAEICFWNYSQAQLSDLVQSNSKESILPWGVALMRCPLDVQRGFLADLYEE